MKGFLIAADKSGSGKTTITTGIIYSLKKSGYKIAPFKCGPDYIDTLHLSKASGNKANNLDTVLLKEKELKNIFNKACSGKDIAIAEGVMGLFDGIGYKNFHGSSYEVASLLNLPIILIVNASSASFSIAATIKGFEHLCNNANIAGVILNNVASENHKKLLVNSIDSHTKVKVIGSIPKQKEKILNSRHLGIKTAFEISENYFEKCSNLVKQHVDLDFLKNLQIKNTVLENSYNEKCHKKEKKCYVAYDEAFNFYYQANFDRIKSLGYEIIFFSPLKNETADNADFIYLGGGYPEIYAKQLSKNKKFLNSIKTHFEKNKPMIAECGGMMVLTKGIHMGNNFYEMTGIFDSETIMTEKRQALGYVKAELDGKEFIGHEFHYSKLVNNKENLILNITKITTGKKTNDGFFKKKTLATYVHFHFMSKPSILDKILNL